jgi:hypothetical protein
MPTRLHNLHIQTKILVSLSSSLFLSLIVQLYEYYAGLIIANSTLVIIIFSTYVIDIALGIFKHLKLRDFSFRELLLKAMLKLFIGFASMVIFNGFSVILEHDAAFIKTYFVLVGKLLTLVYYAGSASNSMSVLTNGKFPPTAWMNRMSEFTKTLNPKKLVNNE